MTQGRWRLCDQDTGRTVVSSLIVADTAWKRTIGLLGRGALSPDEAMLIAPCNGIHTLGMGFTLDVVFLDRDGRALRVVARLRPWRFCGPVRGARAVIELPEGAIARQGLQVGRRYIAVAS